MARYHLMPGVVLILVGILFLLYNVGALDTRWGESWSLVLVAVGALLFLTTVSNPDKGAVFLGTLFILIGVFLWLWRGDVIDGDMENLWPVFVIFLGIAFLVRFLFQPEGYGHLISGGIVLAIGGILLLNTHGALPWTTWEIIWRGWPLILIFIGLGMVLRGRRAGGEQ